MPQSIAQHLTMHLGGTIERIVPLREKEHVADFIQTNATDGLSFFILGGGSNTIFSDRHHSLSVGKMEIDGIHTIHESHNTITFRIGAGVSWDRFVAYAVSHNLQGIEMLSAIPGTVGATPIQNVGAYGGDIQSVLDEVEVYDTKVREYTTIPKSTCKFGYRDSLFKHEKNRFIVHHVVFTLAKQSPHTQAPIPHYAGVQERLATLNIQNPTLADIRNTIIAIRAEKLPDPSVIYNSGSFFKNPRLSKEAGEVFVEKFPTAPHFIERDGLYKIPAGWLLEHTGFKGFPGPVGTYEKNALVVVNRGGTFTDLETLVSTIQTSVREKFTIELEIEPEIMR